MKQMSIGRNTFVANLGFVDFIYGITIYQNTMWVPCMLHAGRTFDEKINQEMSQIYMPRL